MKILVFDTETSGLSPIKNHILQLSWQVVDTYDWLVEKECNYYFAYPSGKNGIEGGAIAVNGLTEEYLASKVLSDRDEVIKEFIGDVGGVDVMIAHNLDFDKSFIISYCERNDIDFEVLKNITKFDTMKSTTNLCKIPGKRGGYKWPKLVELSEYLGIDYSDISLHDSSGDVELTKRCYKELMEALENDEIMDLNNEEEGGEYLTAGTALGCIIGVIIGVILLAAMCAH